MSVAVSVGDHARARAVAPIRLGFVTARAAAFAPSEVRTDAGLGRLIDALAARVSELRVGLAETSHAHVLHDHALALARDRVVRLPQLPSVKRGFFKALPVARAMREIDASSDVVVVQLPFAAVLGVALPRKPRVYHVCADVYEIAASHYTGATGVVARATAAAIHEVERALIARVDSRAVTNGRDLYDRLGVARGRAVVSSALLEDEIGSVKRTRPRDAPFRVLFVGYLRPEKGFDVLLDAFEALLRDVPDAELVIVGAAAKVDGGVQSTLEARASALAARGRVQILGAKRFGPELFEAFANADVLALTSRSEGTPRVLVEARAFGCPVVASRVGGIPTSVQDGVDGLLFPPGDAAALGRILVSLARDSGLRARLSAAGSTRVRAMTVEALADALVDEASAALASSRSR